jgi:hypothetical protein
LDSGRQRVLIARLAAAQVAAFEKLSAEGARTLAVVNKRYRLISPTTRVLCASVVGFDGCFPGRDSHPFDGLSSAIEH